MTMVVHQFLLLTLPFLCATLGVPLMDDDGVPELKWPEKYSIDKIKVVLNADLEESSRIWHEGSSKRIRIDYNKGVVKQFYFGCNTTDCDDENDNNTIKIEIHPEAANNKINFVCYKPDSTDDFFDPDDVLPDVSPFEFVSKEIRNGLSSSKFIDETEYEDWKLLETIWASYNNTIEEWIPVKYEKIVYNTWHGLLKNHEVWDFENFDSDFDDDVFSTEQYCNNEKAETINHEMNDEVVTKHLVFIDPENEKHVNHVFETFKTKYKRTYADKTEHAMRKAIFHKNIRLIVSTNRKNLGYKLSVNHLSDRFHEEMKRHMGLKHSLLLEDGSEPFPYNERQLVKLSSEIPVEFDLRLLGVVSPVQNQENCGSCWAFAVASVAEGALALSNVGRLLRLSTQALIDCTWEFGTSGCNGGDETEAYKWIMKYGMPTEEEYGSYTDQDGVCNIKNMNKTYRIKGFTKVTPKNVEALKVALYHHGPVSVSVEANDAFKLYSGGIFYDVTCSEDTSHAVTLVGYGEFYGEPFWILKNSWGPEWGIGGYMHISAKNDNCGIMTKPVYVSY